MTMEGLQRLQDISRLAKERKGWIQLLVSWSILARKTQRLQQAFHLASKHPGIGRGFLQWYHNLVLLKTKLASEGASTSYHIHLDGHLGFGYSQY